MKAIMLVALMVISMIWIGCATRYHAISGRVVKTVPVRHDHNNGGAYAVDVMFEDGREIRFSNDIPIPIKGTVCTLEYYQANDSDIGNKLEKITIDDEVTEVP